MGIPLSHKCLTTIPKGSRGKRPETKKTSREEVVIWSDLHGDMQLPVRAGKGSRPFLNKMSADIFLGVPFNITSYAALTMMVAQVVNMIPGDFVHTFGDLHIYNNHFAQVEEQLSREPRPLPKLVLNPNVKDIFAFTLKDFTITGYDPHPAIKAEVSV